MITPDEFRLRIRAFLAAGEMTATQLGIEAVRDPNFVGDVLKRGRVPSLTLASKVLATIDQRTAMRPPTPSPQSTEGATR